MPRAFSPRFRLVAVALASLVLAAALAWVFNPGPQWRVADTQQASGNVLFDGDPIPAVDVEAMNDLLLGGTVIEWRGFGDLELVSAGQAVLAIAPETVVTLPAPPPRWFARTTRARLAAWWDGEIFDEATRTAVGPYDSVFCGLSGYKFAGIAALT